MTDMAWQHVGPQGQRRWLNGDRWSLRGRTRANCYAIIDGSTPLTATMFR
jgi:hypothetical protein